MSDITDEQIIALRREAADAGDFITVGWCDNALRYKGGTLGAYYRARLSCVIANAEAAK